MKQMLLLSAVLALVILEVSGIVEFSCQNKMHHGYRIRLDECTVDSVSLTQQDQEISLKKPGYLKEIVSLELESSSIEVLPAQLLQLFPLKELHISSSKINDGRIDDNLLRHMTPLEVLDLSFNELTEVSEGAFNGLRNLKIIRMRNNKLERIPLNLFSSNGGLEEIDLSSNKLSKIHYGSFQFKALERLYLSGNLCVDKDYRNKNELQYMVGDLRETCLRNYG